MWVFYLLFLMSCSKIVCCCFIHIHYNILSASEWCGFELYALEKLLQMRFKIIHMYWWLNSFSLEILILKKRKKASFSILTIFVQCMNCMHMIWGCKYTQINLCRQIFDYKWWVSCSFRKNINLHLDFKHHPTKPTTIVISLSSSLQVGMRSSNIETKCYYHRCKHTKAHTYNSKKQERKIDMKKKFCFFLVLILVLPLHDSFTRTSQTAYSSTAQTTYTLIINLLFTIESKNLT